ncbi:hypothetical protein DAEQUDRAFT_674804, partial [Daedalea quercina L-15889]
TMPLLALTPDVLDPVLRLLPTSDALAFALVSHTAHDLALPRILAHVTLGGAFHRPAHRPSPNAQLRAFCTVLRAHPARAALVRSLQLRRDAAVAMLAETLTRASGLQRVTFWGFAQLVDACPGIVDALAGCHRLQTVILGGQVPPLDVLQRAFPRVRTLEFVEGGGACFQPTSRTPSTIDIRAWSAVDRISAGRPPVLSPTSAPVRARHLTLHDPLSNNEQQIQDTLAFIKQARPVVLSVAIDVGLPDDAFVERLPDVCIGDGRDGYKGVRYLTLILSGCRSLVAVENWMTRTALLLARLPLAALALRSATPAAFPTPRPTPVASPLSSPRLVPSASPSPSAPYDDDDVAALTLDADDRARTVHGAPRRAPPAVAALARAVAEAAPGLRWLALAPAGPDPDARGADAKAEWFAVVRGCARAKGRLGGVRTACLRAEEAARVYRKLEAFGRWD